MNLSAFVIISTIASAAAFTTPSSSFQRSRVIANAEQQSRATFVNAAIASIFAGIPAVANAGTMSQENVSDPTEVWETGNPSQQVRELRIGRYTNARTQLDSSFPPIKRISLERKSPVTRLDINAPSFSAYKKTYPGLYKEVPTK